MTARGPDPSHRDRLFHGNTFSLPRLDSETWSEHMSSRFLISTAFIFTLTLPAFGQGAGSGAASSATSATGGTSAGATVGTPSSATGGTQDNRNVQPSNAAKAVQQQRDAATTGSNTAPSQPGDGAVSAP